MAQLIVRNLEDEVRDRLRSLAQTHGRSMEEEVRDILRAAVVADTEAAAQPGLGSRISRRFTDCHLDDDFVVPEWRGHDARPARFSD